MQKDINARIYVLSIAAVAALYVVVSLIVALARFPGPVVDKKGGYRTQDTATVTNPAETGELFGGTLPAPIEWSLAGRHHPGAASTNVTTANPDIGAMVAQVSMPPHYGIIGCTPSTLPPRFKRPPEEFTRF